MNQIIQSLCLDVRMLKLPYVSVMQKLEFIIKKYYLIIKYIVFKIDYKIGDTIILWGELLYINGKYGLADFQSLLVRDYSLLNNYKQYITQGAVVFDVGCNMGLFTKFINHAYYVNKIYAIDPIVNVLEYAKKNNKGKNNVHYINQAISNYTGDIEIMIDPVDTYRASVVNTQQGLNNKVIVSCSTLDDVCSEYNIDAVDLLKIDVEGFEKEVLMGSQSILRKTKLLLIEIEVKNNRGVTFPEVLSLLSGEDLHFDLIGFINFEQIREGSMSVGDFLFINRAL